ncbi:RNA polymerase sigma factor [Aeromicrobium sp. YIM 150415]|uniref:RNA polymerase sigma factor n=1 Tax=Aeromicrobium sp. YIM 150415 TaxID=2803912 RepID=UPI00196342F4|nr:DUF6596 domain-containing protein [Aeromicrobium sp. YIM 150415]MBM9464271.1 RNA polymerase sigma factor [Aeromicrobium sp. YIM 150415]
MTTLAERRIVRTFRGAHAVAAAAVLHDSGDLDLVEAATDAAFAEASESWDRDGIPEQPDRWVLATARRAALDRLRGADTPRPRALAALVEDTAEDHRLALVFTCCHPALHLPARVALVLRFCAGLSLTEIAHAFGVDDATMRRRLDLAKRPITRGDISFAAPAVADLDDRLDAVLAVLYLIFNEGYVGSRSATLTGDDLSEEAIGLTRSLLSQLPDHDDIRGLLALMLFIRSRRRARIGLHGDLIALSHQDRGLWESDTIAEAGFLLRQGRRSPRLSRYTVEAEIQALHAATADGTPADWRAVLAHYDTLRIIAPGPSVDLNRAVALAEVEGPAIALEVVDTLPADSHLWHAVRAELLERLGRFEEAQRQWQVGSARAEPGAEQAYMATHATRRSL